MHKIIKLMCFTVTRSVAVIVLYGYFLLEAIGKVILPRFLFRKDVKGQVVLITGGGSGIGRKLAQSFASRGAKIVSWDINDIANSETAESIRERGGVCFAYTIDVTYAEAVQELAEQVYSDVGRVDILINNAGLIGDITHITESSVSSIQKVFQVNVLSLFWMVKAFLPDMLRTGTGHVVTIGSLCGKLPFYLSVDYSASKYATVGFDEALRLQLDCGGHSNIQTTLVCPTFTDTPMIHENKKLSMFPTLNLDVATKEIMDAILTNTYVQIIPATAKAIPVFRVIYPRKLRSLAYRYVVEGLQIMNDDA